MPIIHNAHDFFLARPSWSAGSWRRWSIRRRLRRKAAAIGFLDANIRDAARALAGPDECIVDVPFALFMDREAAEPPADGVARLVVPGGVSSARRDFDTLFAALEIAGRKRPRALHVVLLGQMPDTADGRSILKRCDALRSAGVSVETFSASVPEDAFLRHLANATAIVAPVRPEYVIGGIAEQYGLSKATGAVGDQIRSGLPMFLPSSVGPGAGLEEATISYNGPDQLAGLVARLVDDGPWRERFRANARKAAARFDEAWAGQKMAALLEAAADRRR